MRQNPYCRWAVAALLIGILCVLGCGKKGDPIPQQVRMPAAVSDLSALSSAEGIVLRWSLPAPPQWMGSFRILRSDVAAGDACPGCPRDHRMLVQLSMEEGRLQREEGKFRYLDTDVRPGRFYSYRVAGCNPKGDCGEASNTAQQFYPPR